MWKSILVDTQAIVSIQRIESPHSSSLSTTNPLPATPVESWAIEVNTVLPTLLLAINLAFALAPFAHATLSPSANHANLCPTRGTPEGTTTATPSHGGNTAVRDAPTYVVIASVLTPVTVLTSPRGDAAAMSTSDTPIEIDTPKWMHRN